ncbi:MAG: DUF1661 domain-containing protein [Bacteroidia bacterium]
MKKSRARAEIFSRHVFGMANNNFHGRECRARRDGCNASVLFVKE